MRRPVNATLALLTLTLALGCAEPEPEPEPEDEERGFFLTHVDVDPDGLIIAGFAFDLETSNDTRDLFILRSPDGETWTTETIPRAGRPKSLVVGPDTVVITTQPQGLDGDRSQLWVRQGDGPFVRSETLDWERISHLVHTGDEYVAVTFDPDNLAVSLVTSTDLVDWQLEEPDMTIGDPQLMATPGGDLWVHGASHRVLHRPAGGPWQILVHGLSVVSAMGQVHGRIVGLGLTDLCAGQDLGCVTHERIVWDEASLAFTRTDIPIQHSTAIVEAGPDAVLHVGGSIILATGDPDLPNWETVWPQGVGASVYAITRFGDAFIAVGEMLLRSDDDGRTWYPIDIPLPPS